MDSYQTALVVGRAFALANSGGHGLQEAATELCRLAGDRRTLMAARQRFHELLERRFTVEDLRASELLELAAAMSVPPTSPTSGELALLPA
jgi:hypothetical protein